MASTNLSKSSGSVLTASEVNSLLKFDSNDRVGLGTTSPLYRIHLQSSSALDPGIMIESTSNLDAGFRLKNSSREISFDNITGGIFRIYDRTAGSQRLRMESSGNFGAGTDNSQTFGTASLRWSDIYAASGSVNTSDGREKDNIKTISAGVDFVKKLKPVEFNYKWGSRTHYGFIAQDLEQIIKETGEDFAAFVKSEITDEDGEKTDRLGIRYSELIAPLVKAFQEAYIEFDNRLKLLEGK